MKRKIVEKNFFWSGFDFFCCCSFWPAHPIFHLVKTAWNDKNEIVPTAPGKINDASRLDETHVAKIWEIPTAREAAEKQLAELLQFARTNHLKVSIAGARHSMGGHVIYPDGIVIDMLPFNRMELDGTNLVLHVQAGARWSEVISFLNARGFRSKSCNPTMIFPSAVR